MREIKTEIDISAPAEKVWDILMDINNWQQWNPIINQASGIAAAGSKLTITMKGKEGKNGPKYMPVIINFDAPNLFQWRAKMMAGFLFTNDKIFELKEIDSGTQLIHKEAFGGILVPMFWGNLQQHVPAMLDAMNEALKKSVESSSNQN